VDEDERGPSLHRPLACTASSLSATPRATRSESPTASRTASERPERERGVSTLRLLLAQSRREALLDVAHNVVDVLGSDRQAHELAVDAQLAPVLRVDARVRHEER